MIPTMINKKQGLTDSVSNQIQERSICSTDNRMEIKELKPHSLVQILFKKKKKRC